MSGRSLEQWLRWQESLSPATIVMGLERVRAVAGRLGLQPPPGAVFTITGTNGKGSTARLLELALLQLGRRPGVYASPHLLRYNERIRLAGYAIEDEPLVDSFAAVEAARGDVPLTYFEFGTLSALHAFGPARCDAWVLEVGMGGRLDAVNVIDPDYSLITTVALDHQRWLGESVEAIAAEKAGILRAAGHGYYGDAPLPESIRTRAAELGLVLRCFGEDFGCSRRADGWDWYYREHRLDGLPAPAHWTGAQLRNASLALAALADHAPAILQAPGALAAVFAAPALPGRLQRIQRAHEWVLDVAHNAQAAGVLREQLDRLPAAADTTLVIGMLADKAIEDVVAALAPVTRRWILCRSEDPRAASLERLRAALAPAGLTAAGAEADVGQALACAARLTAPGGRIIVCGSFRVVGPALRWLELN